MKKIIKILDCFFQTFELPDEGRLTSEEAKELWPDPPTYAGVGGEIEFTDDLVFYKNYLFFDKGTKMAADYYFQNYDPNNYERVEPFDTQAIGVFMRLIHDIHDIGYPTATGELVQEYEDLTEEDYEYLKKDEEYDERVQRNEYKGRAGFDMFIEGLQQSLKSIEPYIKEYRELYIWSKETRQYMYMANQFCK